MKTNKIEALLAIYDHYLEDRYLDDDSRTFQEWLYEGLYWKDLTKRFSEALNEYLGEVKLNFENERELDEFLGQLSDGWGENYISITRHLTNAREYNVSMLDTEWYRKDGWHIQKLVADGLWMDVENKLFDTRYEAIKYCVIEERNNLDVNLKLRVKEDYEYE